MRVPPWRGSGTSNPPERGGRGHARRRSACLLDHDRAVETYARPAALDLFGPLTSHSFHMRMPNLLASKNGRLAAFFFLYINTGISFWFTAIAIAVHVI